MRLGTLSLGFLLGAVVFIGASVILAWTGPTSAPPNGNVAAPLNVGTTDQIKNAGLGINSLAVFGDTILSGTSRYLNFGSTAGTSGYGIRDNAGAMEVKNNAGSWSAMLFASSTFSQIKFADGTMQTTAATTTFFNSRWHDVRSSRSLNATYVNTTGHPIEVSVSIYSGATGSTCSIGITIDGVLVAPQFMNNNVGAALCSATVTVPPGSTYSATGVNTLYYWTELF